MRDQRNAARFGSALSVLGRDDARRPSSRVARRRFAAIRAALETLEHRTLLSANLTGSSGLTTAITQSQGTYVVTTTTGTGTGSLPAAIAFANSNVIPTSITFDPTVFATPQTITVSELDLTNTSEATTITGPAAGVTLSGGGNSRVFSIASSVTTNLSGLTITDGSTAGNGGGIYNLGALTLTNSTFSSNSADAGGAVYNDVGSSEIVNGCTFNGNSTTSDDGGAIYIEYDATFSNGHITNSTFYGNTAAGEGGALYLGTGNITIADSTFSDNTTLEAQGAGGAIGVGGEGIPAASNNITLTADIIAGNFFYNGSTNTADDISTEAVAPSFIVTGSYNLIGTGGSGGLVDGTNHNQVGVANPGLGILQNNDGPTQTVALLSGTPAIGKGVAIDGISTDQRGLIRPATPDVGAFQTGGSYTITVNDNADTPLDNPTTDFPNQLGTSITLRDAINAANNAQGTTTIVLAKTTYDFTTVDNNWYGPNALPAIDSNITLQGNGATLQRDSSLPQTTAGAFRFFYVSGGIQSELPLGTLKLQNLTLTNGLAKGGESTLGGGGLGAGGAIFNQGDTTLSGVTLSNNTALGGSSGDIGTLVQDPSNPKNPNKTYPSYLTFGGGGIGQDAILTLDKGGASIAGPGGGFGGSFPDGLYGGLGNLQGGGGFDSTSQSQFGGGYSGLGGDLEDGQGHGGDGGTNVEQNPPTGADFGFGATVPTDQAGRSGGVGGGGSANVAGTGAGEGGFGGGGGSGSNGGYPTSGDNGFNGGDGGFGGGGGSGRSDFTGHGGFGAGDGASGMGNSGGGGAGMGGAVFSMYGSLTIVNSTLTANTARGGSGVNSQYPSDSTGGSGLGGAVFNLDGAVDIESSTLAGNTVAGGTQYVNGTTTAPADGGSLYNLAYGSDHDTGAAVTAAATINNSILFGTIGGTNDLVNHEVDGGYASGFSPQPNTGNTATVTAGAPDIVGAFTTLSDGNAPTNGSSNDGTATTSLTGVIQSSPQLTALGNYGGLTQTMALLPGSPAIGAGATADYPGTTTPIATDQTGFTRSASKPSIGAYENEGFTIATNGGTPQSTPISTGFTTALGVKVTSNNAAITNLAGAAITLTVPAQTSASATFSKNPFTLFSDGTGSTTATANAKPGGPYNVTASSSGITTAATFVLTNTTATSASGSLAGSSGPTAKSYNLTQLGTIDWIHWGTGQNASTFDDKATGGGQISNVSRTGPGSYGAYTDSSRDVIWSDGMPLAKDNGDQSYIWANNATGAGYTFTAPADTTTRTLYVYLGGYDSGGTLTATLSDSSATPYTTSFSGSAIYNDIVAITYKAGSASQHLLISYTKTAGVGVASGSVDLDAAWIGQPLTNLSPVIGLNPKSQTVTTGTDVTFTASASTIGTAPPTVQWYMSTNGGASFTLIPGQTNTTLDIGPATLAESGNEYEAIFTTSAGTAVTSPATLTVNPAPAPGGSLVGSSSAAGASYNYTTLGNTDWIHWGRASNVNNVDRKAMGGSQISNVTRTSAGSYGAYADPSRDSIWSDGMPTAKDTGDTAYIWANNAAGAGYTFTAPADTTTRTLYIYLGGYDSGGTLTATLSDGSATPYTVSFSGSSIYTKLVAITYKAGAAGQKLNLSYTKTANVGVIGGSVDLIGAWLG